MPRTARTVIPGLPHLIVQRGNRRQDVFFGADDYRMYLSLMAEKCAQAGTEILAYCLMQNHVQLIAVPRDEDGLRALGEAHRRYTRYINAQNDWQGYLWAGRFSSFPMDQDYLFEAVRYVELSPVRAGICPHPSNYRWSSARQRLGKSCDGDLAVPPLDTLTRDWDAYWQEGLSRYDAIRAFENNESAQKPLGQVRTAASA
ncbi:MAG: transposase [Rhodospirillales bacterium]|nr:transposase [Rhodospirillales bacterium]MCB9996266.1 transposase [Rhodospirillales bacterium]